MTDKISVSNPPPPYTPPPPPPPHLTPPHPTPLPSALEELGLEDVDSVVVAFPSSAHTPETMAAMKEVWKVRKEPSRMHETNEFSNLFHIHLLYLPLIECGAVGSRRSDRDSGCGRLDEATTGGATRLGHREFHLPLHSFTPSYYTQHLTMLASTIDYLQAIFVLLSEASIIPLSSLYIQWKQIRIYS